MINISLSLEESNPTARSRLIRCEISVMFSERGYKIAARGLEEQAIVKVLTGIEANLSKHTYGSEIRPITVLFIVTSEKNLPYVTADKKDRFWFNW